MSIITTTLAALTLGESARAGALTVFPLLGADDPVPEYLTLDEALARGCVRVTEVSASGVVPELKVANSGELPILLLDGELLVGAKQNRILNLSILVPPKREMTIPVSCIEVGRWAWQGERFRASACAAPATLRAAKGARVSESLARGGERHSNQGEVWAQVDGLMNDMGLASPTHDMHDAFEAKEHELRDLDRELPRHANQRGALFGIGARMAGLDLFDRAATFAAYRAKLVRSYGMEALAGRADGNRTDLHDAARFLDFLGMASTESYPALGLGEDLRLRTAGITGAALALEGRIAHLCAFAEAGVRQREPHTETPVAPARLRGRHLF